MKTGFVNIFGKPNAGKSTLLNALLDEKLAIVSSKVQTTRHRIKGFLTEAGKYQIVFSDTPGFIDEPAYRMHQVMNAFINLSFDDADIILFLTDPYEPLGEHHSLIKRISTHPSPALIIINKKEQAIHDNLPKLVISYLL